MESARFGTFAAADRTTLHELNTRLARYVEHVQRLEARNRALRSDLLTARRQRGSAPSAIDTRDAEVRRSRETVRVLSLEVARDALLRERLRGERAWQQARLESEERGLHELQAASEAALHEVEEQRAFGAELEAGAERIAREMESACETHTREMSAWRARLQQLQRVSVYASPVNVFPTEEELLALESTAAKAGILVAERLEGELMSYTEELNHEQVQKQEMEQEVAGLAQMLQNLQLKAAEVSEQRVHLEHTAREMEERFHSHLASLQERAEDLEQESSELQMVALQQSRESRELAAAEMRLRLEIAAYRSMLQMECGDPMFDEKEQQLRIQQKGLRQQQKKSWMHSPHKYYQRTDVGPSLRTHTETAKVNRRRHDWIYNQRVKSPTMLALNRSPQTAFGLSRSKRLGGESATRSSSVKIQHSMEGKTIHGIQKEQKSDVSIYKIQELSEQSSKVSSQTETDVAENKVHDIVPTACEMEPASKYIEDPNRIWTIEEKKAVESGDLSTPTSLELLKEDSFETTPAAESVMESCTVAIIDKQKDELSEHVGTNSVLEYPEECEQTLISDDVDKTNVQVASLPPVQQGNESEMHENTATDSQTSDTKEQYFPLLMETEPLEEQNPQPYDTCAKTEEPVLSPSSQLYLDEQPLGIHEGDNVFTDPENWEEVQNACERLEATTRSTDLQLTKEGEMSLDLPENSEKDDQDRNVEFDLELPSTNKICVISTVESSAQDDDINIIEGLDKQYIHPERSSSPKDKDSSFQLELEMKPESEEEPLQPKQQFHEIAHKEEAYSGTCDDVISQSEENITDSVTEVTETLKTHDSEEQNPQPYDTCAKTEEPVLSPSSQLYLDEQPLGIHEGDNVFTDPENWEEVQNVCERLEATTRSTDLQLTKEGEMSLDLPENSEKDDQDRNVEFDLELPSTNKICVISTVESSAQDDDINIIEGLDKQYIHPERPFSPKDKDSSFQLELEMKPESEEESLQPKQQFHEIAHKEEAYSGTCDDVISQSEENITDSVTEVTETLKTHDSEVEDFTVSVGTSSSMSPHSKEDHIYDYGKTYGATEEIHELHINESSEEERQSSHESALQVLESTSEAEHVLQDESLALPQEVQEISTKEFKLEEPFSPLSEQTDMTKEAVLKESSEIIPSKMMECNIAEQAKVIFECEEELDELTLTRADDESYCIEEEEEEECVSGDAPATNSSLKYGDDQEMVHSEEELRDDPSQKEEPDQLVMHESNASQNEADVTSDADDEIGEEIKVFGHKHLLKDQLPTRLLTDNVPETPVDFSEEAPDHYKETLPDIPTSDLERSLLEYQNTTSESVPQTTGTEIQAPGLKKEKKVESRSTEVEADVPGGDVALNIVEKETKERKKRLRRRGKKNQTPLAHRSDDTTMISNLQREDSERSVDHKSEQESRLYEESAIPHEEASTRSNECELKVSGSLVEVWTEKSDTISTDGMENVAVSFAADNVSLKHMEEGKDKQEWEGAQDEWHIHEDMEQFPRTDIDSFTGKNVTDSGFVDASVSDMCILSTSVGALSKSTTSESLQDEGATFQQDRHEYFLTREGVAGETHIPESESKDESTVIENGLVKTDEEEKERKSYKAEGDIFEEGTIPFSKSNEMRNEGEEEQYFIASNTDDCAVEPDDSFKLQPNQLEEFSHAGEYYGCDDRNVVTDQESFGEQAKENVKELTVQHQEYYSKLSNKKDLAEDMSECDVHDKNHNKKLEDHYVDMMDDFQILPWKDRLSGGDDETSLQNVWRSKNETAQELFKEGGDDQQVTSEIDSLSSQPSLEPPSLTEDSDDVTHEDIRRPDSKSPQILPMVRGDSEDGGDVYVDEVQLTWLSQDTRSFPVVEVFSESSTTGIKMSESSLGLQEKEELLEKEEQSLKASKEDDQKFPSEKAYQVLEAVDATDISKEVSIDYEKERFEKQYQSSEYVTVSVQPLDDEEQTLLFVEDEQNIENVVIPEELESSGDELDEAFAETKNDEQSLSDVKLDEVVTLSDDENCPTTSKNVVIPEELESSRDELDKAFAETKHDEQSLSDVKLDEVVTLSDDENCPTTSKNVEEISAMEEIKLITTKLSPEEKISVVEEGSEPTLEEIHNMSNLFKFQQENGTQPFAEIVLEQTPSKVVDSQTIFIVDEGNEKYPDAQEISDMTQKVEKQDDPALKLKEILRDISTIGAVPLDEQTISFGLNQDKVTGSAVIQSPGLFESDSVKTWHEIKKEKQLFHCEDEDSKILMQDNVEESKQSQNAPISGEFIFEQTGEEQSFLSSKEDDEEEGEKQTLRSESTDKMSPSAYKEERYLPSDELDDHLLSESETTQSTLAAGQEQRSLPNEEIPADSKRQCQEMVELRVEEYLNPSQAILPNVETQVYADFNQNKPERFTDGDLTIQADTEYGRPETSLYEDDKEKELTEFEWHAEQVKSKALDFQVFPELDAEQLDAGELDELDAGHSSFTPEDFTTTDEAKENEFSGIMPISATCSFGTSDSIIQEAIALGNDTPIESDDFHFTSLTQEENIFPSLGTTIESSLAHPHAEDAPEASSTFVKLENQEGFGKEKENDEIAEESDEINTMFQQNYHSYRLTNSNQPVLVDTGEQQVGFMFLDESNVSFQGHSLH